MALSITKQFHFKSGPRTRKVIKEGPAPDIPQGSIPRISRLMALAIRFDEMISAGKVADRAAIARVGYVSRARVTQIMNLLNLAPDIQEEILFLPLTRKGRDPIRESHLRPLTSVLLWSRQRQMWAELLSRLQPERTPGEHTID